MIFDIKNVKTLHLEPTSRCNAACPMCARFLDDGITIDPTLELSDLSLEKLQAVLSNSFIKQIDKMFMCGNFGDPAASNHALLIFDWFRHINPEITLGMNTNGSLRNPNWWSILGRKLNREKDYCVFSLDGLEDTNHIYRRNTSWSKIMKNVAAFINAGGKAHWDMLVFKHNEHQVDDCAKLAKDMGFAVFRAKVSKRFTKRPITGLEPPIVYQPQLQYGEISCQALNDSSIYMDYRGEIIPCCWLAGEKYKISDFNDIIGRWTPTCIKNCASINNSSNFEKQWFREEYFE